MDFYQVCLNEGPRFEDGPAPGGPRRTMEMHRNIFKNLLLQNHSAQLFEIWYEALPSAPLPSLFQMKVLGSKMTSGQET